ncbi:late competence protein ComER [Sporolactobacillus terrae]|uniref:late competence protein ComER n=1 Tax=Sporolactobacillus terrae TaxID=269673 RepID=UPI001EFF65C4|nr:late competence protein ComER [Sporolactobacillus terrae]
MMRIGVIGTGTIGTLLVDALIKSKAAKPHAISVMNRTKAKAEALAKKHPRLSVCESPIDILRRTDLIFLCVKPNQFFPLLRPLRHAWQPSQLAISVTSPITIKQLETYVPCPVARVIPSIVNQSLSGSTLVTFGTRMTDLQKSRLWAVLAQFSNPIEIDEASVRAASDIASCGPAFITYLLRKMIDGAVTTTPLSHKQATQLTTEMIEGLGNVFQEKLYTLEELQNKVTVKGGITGAGLNALENAFHDAFENLFRATQEKFVEDQKKVRESFEQEES